MLSGKAPHGRVLVTGAVRDVWRPGTVAAEIAAETITAGRHTSRQFMRRPRSAQAARHTDHASHRARVDDGRSGARVAARDALTRPASSAPRPVE